MTTQLFYFTASSMGPVGSALFRLASSPGELKYMHLAPYSVLIYVTYEREKAFQACDLLAKDEDDDADAWAVELTPEQMDGLIHDYYKGWEPPRTDPPVCEMRDITERQADRVLDRINKHGLNGIGAADGSILDRYAEQLRLLETEQRIQRDANGNLFPRPTFLSEPRSTMTTQFFYFGTNDSTLNTPSHFRMLLQERGKLTSIPLTDTTALLQVVHNREEPFLSSDFTSSYSGKRSWVIELVSEEVNSMMQDELHGLRSPQEGQVEEQEGQDEAQEEEQNNDAQANEQEDSQQVKSSGDVQKQKGQDPAKKQEERPLCGKSNISERLADRVLDRISKLGLDGITSFERRLLERYSENLRLPENHNKRRP